MDLGDVKEKILTAKQSLAYLLGQLTCNMDKRTPQEAKLTHFCETGRRALTDAAFLAANISWLESLKLINIQSSTKPVLVEFPDFTSMQWLTDPNQKQDSFASKLEGLLVDIRSLEIPTSDCKECSISESERTFSPTTSECSSIEIVDYSDDYSGTITPENKSSNALSQFYEIPNVAESPVQQSEWICPKSERRDMTVSTLRSSSTDRLETSFEYITGTTPKPDGRVVVESVRKGMSLIMNTSHGQWLIRAKISPREEQQKSARRAFYQPGCGAAAEKSRRIRCAIPASPSDRSPTKAAVLSPFGSIDSDCSSVRSTSVKRKADPFLFGVTHGQFTEQSRWLAPPLTNNARVGNASNDGCSDTKRWLVDYRSLNAKRGLRRKLTKKSPTKS